MADTNLSKANKPSFGTRVKRFFKDTKAELKKGHMAWQGTAYS